eukprot:TRINITY_DN2703_c0_g1_i1.p1 TRINITY_DN2703_c0_g1~~TRINITY_DN2703_c0_g1_i1.p1  ORF type:complete len:696 (+),score=164.72 TRINITY_DN2703_c0_g1_i1:71-2158(+)
MGRVGEDEGADDGSDDPILDQLFNSGAARAAAAPAPADRYPTPSGQGATPSPGVPTPSGAALASPCLLASPAMGSGASGASRPRWRDAGIPWPGRPHRHLHRSFITPAGVELSVGDDATFWASEGDVRKGTAALQHGRLWLLYEELGAMLAVVLPFASAPDAFRGHKYTPVHPKELLVNEFFLGLEEDVQAGPPPVPLSQFQGRIHVRTPAECRELTDWEGVEEYTALWAGEDMPKQEFRTLGATECCWACWLAAEGHHVLFRDWSPAEGESQCITLQALDEAGVRGLCQQPCPRGGPAGRTPLAPSPVAPPSDEDRLAVPLRVVEERCTPEGDCEYKVEWEDLSPTWELAKHLTGTDVLKEWQEQQREAAAAAAAAAPAPPRKPGKGGRGRGKGGRGRGKGGKLKRAAAAASPAPAPAAAAPTPAAAPPPAAAAAPAPAAPAPAPTHARAPTDASGAAKDPTPSPPPSFAGRASRATASLGGDDSDDGYSSSTVEIDESMKPGAWFSNLNWMMSYISKREGPRARASRGSKSEGEGASDREADAERVRKAAEILNRANARLRGAQRETGAGPKPRPPRAEAPQQRQQVWCTGGTVRVKCLPPPTPAPMMKPATRSPSPRRLLMRSTSVQQAAGAHGEWHRPGAAPQPTAEPRKRARQAAPADGPSAAGSKRPRSYSGAAEAVAATNYDDEADWE